MENGQLKIENGWEVKPLGELCTIQLGKTPHRKTPRFWDKNKDSNNVWLSIADLKHGNEMYDSKEYISDLGAENVNITPKGTVMVSFKLTLGRVAFAGIDLLTNEAIASLIDLNDKVSKQFLFHYFTYFDWDKATQGDVKLKGKTLNKAKLKVLEIPIPPLDEQKRIVAKLDDCFEAIYKARANVEKNLNNAKELFQSQLNEIFSQPALSEAEGKGDGWVEKKLGECIKLKSGDGLTAKKMNQNGNYPVYGGNGIAGNHDKFNLDGSQVIVGRVGALCGNVRFINEKIWLTDNAFKVSEFYFDFDKKFLTYLLNYKNLRSFARQSAQPVISNSSTKDILLPFPESIEEQKQIVNQLDELKSHTQALESKYQQELDALDELKKSLLQKAFLGQLIMDNG